MSSAHEHLRSATSDAHDRLDAAFSSLNLKDLDDYRTFLIAHARAYLPVEAAIAAAPDAWLPEGWRSIRRSEALEADCAAMGLGINDEFEPPTLDSAAEIAGALYVLEGSRLGARFLTRNVDAAFPSAFLSAAAPKGHWKSFLAWLEGQIVTETELDAASRAATKTHKDPQDPKTESAPFEATCF